MISIRKFIFAVIALLIIGFSGYFVLRESALAPTFIEHLFDTPKDESPQMDDIPLVEIILLDDKSVDNGADDGDSNDDNDSDNNSDNDNDGENEFEDDEPEDAQDTLVSLTISAAGDTTLGGIVGGTQMFMREFERQDRDHSFFLSNVRHIFEEDDLTILNLEGTLTDASGYKEKTYVLRGPPHYAKILSSSGVDVVTLANNHSKDFFERGYRDTIKSLEDEGIAYFGNEFNTILEINGIRVGLFGFSLWGGGRDNERRIANAIKDLREKDAQLIIAYYHWGIERNYSPEKYQRTLGHFSIDNGADLVLGSHPHVIQGIEEYNGKSIVYSMGNFSFGANTNPADHDTFIFQQSFVFENGELQDTHDINIIPASISSEKGRNNFQPTVAEGEEAERILQRIQTYSDKLNGNG